jgi:ABC-type branched-subunit amino acid transport system substrate-binding protein
MLVRPTRRLCAIAGAVSIALLAGCQPPPPPAPVPVAPPPPPPAKIAPHQLTQDEPEFLRLPNMDKAKTPLRVGVILPFSNASAATRVLAAAMMKAAELALFDSGNRDVVLVTADDSAKPEEAAAAAGRLLNQGAEVLVGPLFSASVKAVAPLARDRGVPVIAFSTDREVAGDGIYLLSFQPEDEVHRVVAYAAAEGHRNFAALIPSTGYGHVTEQAFRKAVEASGGTVALVSHFAPGAGTVMDETAAVSKSGADAIFIAQGGTMLRNLAPNLANSGVDVAKVKLIGTGLWDDPAIAKEPSLKDGWFAAPSPDAEAAFAAKYRAAFGATPPHLATLAYDAVSLVALLGAGQPYHRFNETTLTDPNGFAGVDGIFRFNKDGSIERGLSVLAVQPNGFSVVNPAPKTFEGKGS